uniref:Uncharacterized protein n=1 Tax=Desulfobacca acetoxidans TaxID=60893 RepID=A0A7V4G8K1_9BACT
MLWEELSALFIGLWVSGWTLAGLWAVGKARAEAGMAPASARRRSRPESTATLAERGTAG